MMRSWYSGKSEGCMPHWWGDARLDKTPWLQMKGMMTPHEAPLVLTHWERFLHKLSIR
jgi:hypothetical protein